MGDVVIGIAAVACMCLMAVIRTRKLVKEAERKGREDDTESSGRTDK